MELKPLEEQGKVEGFFSNAENADKVGVMDIAIFRTIFFELFLITLLTLNFVY